MSRKILQCRIICFLSIISAVQHYFLSLEYICKYLQCSITSFLLNIFANICGVHYFLSLEYICKYPRRSFTSFSPENICKYPRRVPARYPGLAWVWNVRIFRGMFSVIPGIVWTFQQVYKVCRESEFYSSILQYNYLQLEIGISRPRFLSLIIQCRGNIRTNCKLYNTVGKLLLNNALEKQFQFFYL